MASVYAGLRSIGVGPDLAMAAHLLVALAGLLMLGLSVTRGWQVERRLAVALLASLLVSPYLYDYDLCLIGLAMALIAKDVARFCSKAQSAAILGLCWLASGYGLIGTLVAQVQDRAAPAAGAASQPAALGAFALLALAAAITAVLWRAEGGTVTLAPATRPRPVWLGFTKRLGAT